MMVVESSGRGTAHDVLEASAKAYINAVNRTINRQQYNQNVNKFSKRINKGGRKMRKRIAILPGDGIGPEVCEAATRVLTEIGRIYNHEFELKEGLLGGVAIDETGHLYQKKRFLFVSKVMRFC